jgi:hypothetical protein
LDDCFRGRPLLFMLKRLDKEQHFLNKCDDLLRLYCRETNQEDYTSVSGSWRIDVNGHKYRQWSKRNWELLKALSDLKQMYRTAINQDS